MKIIIVDDDILVSTSLKTIVESSGEVQVLALGASGEEAIRLYDLHQPDILLMDIRMGGMTGLEAGREVLNRHREAKLLFLTTFSDDEYIVAALKMGAKGYILKQHFEALLPALKAVGNGHSVFGEEIVSKLPSILGSGTERKEASAYGLVDKEFDIVKLVAQGLSNKEISGQLYLSEGTVRNYISVILEKLGLRDRTQLAIFYFNHLQ